MVIYFKKLLKKRLNNFLLKRDLILINKKPISNLFLKNNIIILAPQRSGSTFLLNSLRGHPLIEMIPSNFFHTLFLNCNVNRYPSDLVNNDNCNLSIIDNIENSKIDRIPSYKFDLNFFSHEEKQCLKRLSNNRYNIEKIHSKFLNHDLDSLNDNITRLKNINTKINLKFIYLIRDPIKIIDSIYNYNERNNSWGTQQADEVDFLFYTQLNSFKFIEESQKKFPGILIDYSNLVENYVSVISNIFEFLWENNKDLKSINLKVADGVQALINKDKKTNIKSKFLSKKEKLNNMNSKTKYLLENEKDRIDEIYKRYNKLISVNNKKGKRN
tara:strand:+ start:199 stop:1182 length:984 start_codon:yes stop_codon:yes gene_type:complete